MSKKKKEKVMFTDSGLVVYISGILLLSLVNGFLNEVFNTNITNLVCSRWEQPGSEVLFTGVLVICWPITLVVYLLIAIPVFFFKIGKAFGILVKRIKGKK